MSKFESTQSFQTFYKSGQSIFVTYDGYIIADDGKNINYVKLDGLKKICTFNDDNESISCFVANPQTETVILARTDMQLKRIDRHEKKTYKNWMSMHKSLITVMSLDGESKVLATGSSDTVVRIWNIGHGSTTYTCNFHKSKITLLQNHPTKSILISGDMVEPTLACWNTKNGQMLGKFEGHTGPVTSIQFYTVSDDIMISTSRDESVIIWDVASFAKRSVISVQESLETCILTTPSDMNLPSEENYLLIVGGASGIMKVLSPEKRVVVKEYKKASMFNFTNENNHIIEDLNDMRLIRIILKVKDSIVVVRECNNIEFYNLSMQKQIELTGELFSVRDVQYIGNNNDRLLVVEPACYMRLLDNSSDSEGLTRYWSSELVSGGHCAEVTCVSVFGDNDLVISGAKDGQLCVWRFTPEDSKNSLKLVCTANCTEVMQTDPSFVIGVRANRSGKNIFVQYSVANTVHEHKKKKNVTYSMSVFRFKKDKLEYMGQQLDNHRGEVMTMDVSIDGNLCATAGEDKIIKLWKCSKKITDKVATYNVKSSGVLTGHRKSVWSVKFSEIDVALLSGSADSTISYWCLKTCTNLWDLKNEFPVYRAMFYKKEKLILALDSSSCISIWNIEKRKIAHSIEDKNSENCLNSFNVFRADGVENGFMVYGDPSVLTFYKDISDIHDQEILEMNEEAKEMQQELENYVFNKNYDRAFVLALRMQKPLMVFEFLANMSRQRLIPVNFNRGTVASCGDWQIAALVAELDKDLMQRLAKYALKWLNGPRSVSIAQEVLAAIIRCVPNSELFQWSPLMHNISGLVKNSRIYYQESLEDDENASYFEYLKNAISINNIMANDMTMDES